MEFEAFGLISRLADLDFTAGFLASSDQWSREQKILNRAYWGISAIVPSRIKAKWNSNT